MADDEKIHNSTQRMQAVLEQQLLQTMTSRLGKFVRLRKKEYSVTVNNTESRLSHTVTL